MAQKRASEWVRGEELKREGLPVPVGLWGHEVEKLVDLIEQYLTVRRGKGTGEKQLKDVRQRLLKVSLACSWETVQNVQPMAFEKWRAAYDSSAKTRNEYLADWRAFLGWLVRQGRLDRDPLSPVEPISRVQKTRKRRAWTEEEVNTFLAHGWPYRVGFCLALLAGLRRKEIEALQWGDVHLEEGSAFLRLRESTTKNGKESMQLIPEELRTLLLDHRPVACREDDPVLPEGLPRTDTFRRHVEKAGLVYQNAQGERIDFHALRLTYGTLLQRSDLSVRQAQELMRHSDARLTTATYTDVNQLGLTAAVARLPSILRGGIRVGTPVATGDNLTFSDTKPTIVDRMKTVLKEYLSPDGTHCVVTRHEHKMVGAIGLEPTTPTV